MNWLDIIIIIIMGLLFTGGLVWLIVGILDDETGAGIGGFIFALIFILGFFVFNFLVIDKRSGSTVGEITSIDKNFFGTTAVFIKANNNSEEEYCIENDELVPIANEYIGKKVKITYGKRVGIYSTGACSQAPIDKIELVESE